MATGMNQDTGKFRTNTKDQYYTRGSVAKECVDAILVKCPEASEYQWIEPSAGNGAFLKVLPASINRLGIDLDPKMDGILKGDFLAWEPTSPSKKVYFGNPPFGKQGSLAKSFIKHSCEKAEVVAFILPRSFLKPSMSRAFPLKFHCVYEKELPKDSFEVNSVAYDVPCVFQIWIKKTLDRAVTVAVKESGFQYVKATATYHVAFRRVGGKAGTCYLSGSGDFSVQSHYFIAFDVPFVAQIPQIVKLVNEHVFPSNTVGPRSLSKGEVNEVLVEILESL